MGWRFRERPFLNRNTFICYFPKTHCSVVVMPSLIKLHAFLATSEWFVSHIPLRGLVYTVSLICRSTTFQCTFWVMQRVSLNRSRLSLLQRFQMEKKFSSQCATQSKFTYRCPCLRFFSFLTEKVLFFSFLTEKSIFLDAITTSIQFSIMAFHHLRTLTRTKNNKT